MREEGRLTKNSVRCNNCLTVIESTYRHDFRRCQCAEDDNAVWVDGGLAYQRMMVGKNASFEDLCEYGGADEELG